MDGFRWSLRVREAGEHHATAYVRSHQFDVGAPLHFDAKYGQITALEYVLGAIGADLAVGLRARARRRRVAIDEVEAVVEGRLNNPLTYLDVVGEEGHPGIEEVAVTVYVGSPEPQETVQRIWEETLERSPLVRTFRGALELKLRMQVIL